MIQELIEKAKYEIKHVYIPPKPINYKQTVEHILEHPLYKQYRYISRRRIRPFIVYWK